MSEWYADGLRFQCTRCGNCCTGSPGFVWVSEREQEQIARFLGVTTKAFKKRYTRLVGEMHSLVEKHGTTSDCVFLTDDSRCSIQEVKPRQCMTYPFWPRLLASRRAWVEGTLRCPGSNLPDQGDAPLFLPEEIEAIANRDTPREVAWRLMEQKRRD